VHVFFEHGGRQSAGGGAASFLYPFLDDKATDVDALLADVARSVVMKADEIGALREQTLTEGRRRCTRPRRSCGRGSTPAGTLLALGNGGSATDAMDVVADLRAAGRRALDLTEDPAIITALANDIGTDAIFSRQVIAYGGPGDALIALSTAATPSR
jgi:D-sedoheptulose 7-phosphate isomerase